MDPVTDSWVELQNLNQLCHRVRGKVVKLGRSFILGRPFFFFTGKIRMTIILHTIVQKT